MKKSCFWMILLIGSVVCSTASAYNSLYVFGDGTCTTTNNIVSGNLAKDYYGKRYCNGRIWVEVLAQRQGIGISNNWSYFGQYSGPMVNNVKSFQTPSDAANDLFVVWAADADFVGFMSYSLTTNVWNPMINTSLTNHFTIITNLYAKGVRTLIVPNAVDITEIPEYNQSSTSIKSFVRGRTVYFNTNLIATVNRAKAACPGLTVYVPDIFSLLDNAITNAAYYGLTNATLSGQPIDAQDYYGTANATTNSGLGTNFIFCDYMNPTAQMHEVLADTVQQIISPVKIGRISQINGSNEVDIVNVPVGLSGSLDNSTNLVPAVWTSVASFNSLATAQSVFVPTPPLPANFGEGSGSGGSGSLPNPGDTNALSSVSSSNTVYTAAQLYRLRFPYSWNWP